jgi:RNA polymerase sigma-70 factor (ECF subfamily)
VTARAPESGRAPEGAPTKSTGAEAAQDGRASHDDAFERWVLPELPTMYRVALAITGDRAEAEDVVQDSLLRAYRALDRFDGTRPRAWLLTIVRNTHINRNRRRRPMLLGDPDDINRRAPSAPGADAQVIAAVFDSRVEAALQALPADQRSVIQLVDVAALSYQQAADALGVPVGTVMSRLHRGRKRIKKSLSGLAVPGVGDEPGTRDQPGIRDQIERGDL